MATADSRGPLPRVSMRRIARLFRPYKWNLIFVLVLVGASSLVSLINPFLIRAVVAALKKHPIFNSSLDEAAGELISKEYFHLGLAVETDQGLIVPVLRDVDKKNILTLSKELNELAAKTRDRKVSLEELQLC